MDTLKLSLVIGAAFVAALSVSWLAWHYVALCEPCMRVLLALD